LLTIDLSGDVKLFDGDIKGPAQHLSSMDEQN